MPTRFAASVSYGGAGGDAVDIEIDVSYTTNLEYDDDAERWRKPNGQFASAPDTDADAIEERAKEVRDQAAKQMQSAELKEALEGAEISVEDKELVGGRPKGQDNVVRIDPHNSGDWVRYRVDNRGKLRRL